MSWSKVTFMNSTRNLPNLDELAKEMKPKNEELKMKSKHRTGLNLLMKILIYRQERKLT